MQKDIIHLLIIDDDKKIRTLLKKYLIDNGFYVSTAKDTQDARNKLDNYIFDLLIVDIMMPNETGIEFTTKYRKISNTPILILSARGETKDKIIGLEAGADDYLSKPFDPKELLLRIQKIIQRIPTQNENIYHFGNFKFDMQNNKLFENNTKIYTTSSEEILLQILCKNQGKIVSREDIAKENNGINERSIDVQITRLRNKVEQDPKKPIYLKTIRGKGYILICNRGGS